MKTNGKKWRVKKKLASRFWVLMFQSFNKWMNKWMKKEEGKMKREKPPKKINSNKTQQDYK